MKTLKLAFIAGLLTSSALAAPNTTTVPSTLFTEPLTSKVTTLTPTTARAGLNLPQGVAPTVPVNGDIWTTSAGLFIQISGSTAGPIGPGGLTVNGTPVSGGSAGNVLYTDGSKLQAYTTGIPLTQVTQVGPNTVLGNWSSGTNAVIANTMPSCSGASQALIYTNGTGIGCATISGGGPRTFYDASTYSSVANAFLAASSATGGTVWFPSTCGINLNCAQVGGKTYFTPSAQTVAAGITVQCANKNSVQFKAAGATSNIFNVSGAHVVIQDCGFTSFSSSPGTDQTSGIFVNVSADDFSMISNVMDGPYIGVNFATGSAIGHIVDLTVYNITQRTTSANGSAVRCIDGGDIHISQLTIGANGAGQANWPSYGVEIPGGTSIGCALTINDSALLNVNVGLILDPGTSATAYAKASNVWFDNDGAYSVFVCPTSTGVVGQVNITNSEIGPVGGSGIALDTYSGDSCGGTISQATITGNTMFNYTNTTGGGVQVRGANTFNVTVTGNVIGQTSFQYLSAIEIDNAGGNVTAGFNSLNGSSDAIFCSSTGGNILITNNTLNGGSVASACSGAKVTIANNQ